MKSLRKPLFSKKKTYLSVLEKSLLLGLLLSFLLTMTGFSGQCEAHWFKGDGTTLVCEYCDERTLVE